MLRRGFLWKLGYFGAGLLLPTGIRLVFAAPNNAAGLPLDKKSPAEAKRLVVIFQRGACDGLTLLPPVEDDIYHSLRPTIGVAKSATQPLMGPFGLHPGFAALEALWKQGELSFVHQFGSPDPTRSHFDAQDYLESGTPGSKATGEGFLNRALQAEIQGQKNANPLRAVALQPNLPRILQGDANAISMRTIQDFQTGKNPSKGIMGFEALYENAVDQVFRGVGEETFASFKEVQEKVSKTASTVEYPKGELPRRLHEIARLFESNLGVEIAVTEEGNWDTHAGQGGVDGALSKHLKVLGDSLAAFRNDLQASGLWKNTLVLVVTEFGRTARENGTRGTDHGHGSAAMLLGGMLPEKKRGGKIWHEWKAMKAENLYEGRDVPVVYDFRDIFHEAMAAQLALTPAQFADIFPGYSFRNLGFFS